MSETNTPTNTAPSNPKLDKENYVLELKEFSEGNNKGFRFWDISFKSLKAAVDHFTTNSVKGEKGEDVILTLVNSAMAFRLRSQATGRLAPPNDKGQGGMSNTEKLARLNAGGEQLVIISEREAETYVPGQREVESISGLLKAKQAVAKQITTAKAQGNKTVLADLIPKYKELDSKIKALQEAEENRLLDGLSLD